MTVQEIQEALKKPFTEDEIEWRVSQSGLKSDKKTPWAKVVPYIQNRAIMNRLDDIMGIADWKNEFTRWGDKSQLCTLWLKLEGTWIGKTDGADNTNIESTKGGLSDSMKRAAVQWGIGRYLYEYGEFFAIISDKGQHYVKASNNTPAFNWDAPKLNSKKVDNYQTEKPAGWDKKASRPITQKEVELNQVEAARFVQALSDKLNPETKLKIEQAVSTTAPALYKSKLLTTINKITGNEYSDLEVYYEEVFK